MAEQPISYQAATGRLAAASLRCFTIAGAVDHPHLDTTRIIPKALAVAAGDFGSGRIERFLAVEGPRLVRARRGGGEPWGRTVGVPP